MQIQEIDHYYCLFCNSKHVAVSQTDRIEVLRCVMGTYRVEIHFLRLREKHPAQARRYIDARRAFLKSEIRRLEHTSTPYTLSGLDFLRFILEHPE